MNPLLSFTNPLWQFLVRCGIYWAAMSFWKIRFFADAIAGINGPKLSFTESTEMTGQQCRLLIRYVVY